jgi:hypothetical protein
LKDITHALPQVIVDHIAAHNSPDPQAFLETFAPDALLNDAQREFLGHDAIRAWAAKEIFGDNVTLAVQRKRGNMRAGSSSMPNTTVTSTRRTFPIP